MMKIEYEDDENLEIYNREEMLKKMSPEGLAASLEDILLGTFDEITYLNKKCEALKASIAKLKQP